MTGGIIKYGNTPNTGLTDITDYIFYPNMKGMEQDVTLEQIADRIIVDRYDECKIVYL